MQPGRRAVVFTNNDSAYDGGRSTWRRRVEVAAVVDLRDEPPDERARAELEARGIGVLDRPRHRRDGIVAAARASGASRSWPLGRRRRSRSGTVRRIHDCDLVLVSGGWNPTVHLFSQSRASRSGTRPGRLRAGPARQATLRRRRNGAFDLAACLRPRDAEAGAAAGPPAGFRGGGRAAADAADPAPTPMPGAALGVPLPAGFSASGGKRFVDHPERRDRVRHRLAARENYRSVEHLKRYTTLGMGTDQGKTSNINGLGIMADILRARRDPARSAPPRSERPTRR